VLTNRPVWLTNDWQTGLWVKVAVRSSDICQTPLHPYPQTTPWHTNKTNQNKWGWIYLIHYQNESEIYVTVLLFLESKWCSLGIYEIYFLPKFNNNIIGIIFITTYKLHWGVQTIQVKIDGMDLNHIVAIKESVLHALISTVHTVQYKGKPIADVKY